MDIFLWGPRGTGKTWLLDSFIRSINLFEAALRREESPFDLWMEDTLGRRLTRRALEAEATSDIAYDSYTLFRRYDPPNKSEHEELVRLACTHSHTIFMLDGPGDETTGELAITADTPENRSRVLAAHERLKSARYLIVTVERGLEPQSPATGGSTSSTTTSSPYEPGDRYIKALDRLVALDRNPHQKVYLCFTKIDLYQGTGANVAGMLPLLFGDYASDIEGRLRDLTERKGDLPAYFVSAMGYYTDPRTGNIAVNRSGDRLADRANWRPYNVHNPFFSIFDDGEKGVIEKLDIENPVSTPWPEWTRRRIGKKLIEWHRKDLLTAHLSYHKMVGGLAIQI